MSGFKTQQLVDRQLVAVEPHSILLRTTETGSKANLHIIATHFRGDHEPFVVSSSPRRVVCLTTTVPLATTRKLYFPRR